MKDEHYVLGLLATGALCVQTDCHYLRSFLSYPAKFGWMHGHNNNKKLTILITFWLFFAL
jgi:hypothetical protein